MTDSGKLETRDSDKSVTHDSDKSNKHDSSNNESNTHLIDVYNINLTKQELQQHIQDCKDRIKCYRRLIQDEFDEIEHCMILLCAVDFYCPLISETQITPPHHHVARQRRRYGFSDISDYNVRQLLTNELCAHRSNLFKILQGKKQYKQGDQGKSPTQPTPPLLR